MIDKQLENKPIYFEISIGQCHCCSPFDLHNIIVVYTKRQYNSKMAPMGWWPGKMNVVFHAVAIMREDARQHDDSIPMKIKHRQI